MSRALGVSLAVHAGITALLGAWQVGSGVPQRSPGVVATLDRPVAEIGRDLPFTAEPRDDSQPGGGSGLEVVPLSLGPTLLTPTLPGAGRAEMARVNAGFDPGTLALSVGPLGPGGDGAGSPDASGAGSGSGLGVGDGTGDGTGASFFGLGAGGKRFVFVVDASSSMRRPFDGPEKTLFGRVKREIVDCVARMSPEQQFFIVFFNEGAQPMPARGLVAATPEARLHYLRWMIEVKAGGMTEPEQALMLAVGLNPDVIYFLTDGVFRHRVIERVSEVNRQRIAVHTVNFGGDDRAARFLREIAEGNRGTYQYVAAAVTPQFTTGEADTADTSGSGGK